MSLLVFDSAYTIAYLSTQHAVGGCKSAFARKAARSESGALCAAQEKDTGASKAEVEVEHFLAMETVRHFYDSLDFGKELETEYLVAHGKDNTSRRTGAGLVIIRPTTYTRLFSILSPLAAALAAGSVVALEVGRDFFRAFYSSKSANRNENSSRTLCYNLTLSCATSAWV